MTDYTDEEYEAWVMELIEFFRHWPYMDGETIILADPPFEPTPKAVREAGAWNLARRWSSPTRAPPVCGPSFTDWKPRLC